MSTPDPAPAEVVRLELERVVRRWQSLPLGHALAASAGVRRLVQELADEVATVQGLALRAVPDLGPAVLIDQLRVMVHDHAQAGMDPEPLADRLGRLRRSLP